MSDICFVASSRHVDDQEEEADLNDDEEEVMEEVLFLIVSALNMLILAMMCLWRVSKNSMKHIFTEN